MMYSCIIIEDEPLSVERLKQHLAKVDGVECLAWSETAEEAIEYLSHNTVDIIFLDINLGGMTGITLLEKMKLTSQVILTTAYHEYALKGYDLQVTDYLLKPYSFERFNQAVQKAKINLIQKSASNQQHYILVKSEYHVEKINLDDILFIEGMRDYRKIHTAFKRIMTLQTFKDFEKEIPNHIICRVHKSFMVSLQKIENFDKDFLKIGDRQIPISDTYKRIFLEMIDNGKGKM